VRKQEYVEWIKFILVHWPREASEKESRACSLRYKGHAHLEPTASGLEREADGALLLSGLEYPQPASKLPPYAEKRPHLAFQPYTRIISHTCYNDDALIAL
jgi:hypothetical protein